MHRGQTRFVTAKCSTAAGRYQPFRLIADLLANSIAGCANILAVRGNRGRGAPKIVSRCGKRNAPSLRPPHHAKDAGAMERNSNGQLRVPSTPDGEPITLSSVFEIRQDDGGTSFKGAHGSKRGFAVAPRSIPSSSMPSRSAMAKQRRVNPIVRTSNAVKRSLIRADVKIGTFAVLAVPGRKIGARERPSCKVK